MAEIVKLNKLDDEDEAFQEFIDDLKTDAKRIMYIAETEKGEVYVGTTSSTTQDIICDIYRLQRLAENLLEMPRDE